MVRRFKHELISFFEVEKREITLEMERSYLDYAMSVIISRALPDVLQEKQKPKFELPLEE